MSPLCFVPHRAKASPCAGGSGQELDLHSPTACAPGRGSRGSQEQEPGCPEGPCGSVDTWWYVRRRRVPGGQKHTWMEASVLCAVGLGCGMTWLPFPPFPPVPWFSQMSPLQEGEA